MSAQEDTTKKYIAESRGLRDGLKELEDRQDKVKQAIKLKNDQDNQRYSQLSNLVEALSEIVNVLVAEAGEEKVGQLVRANRNTRINNENLQFSNSLEKAITEGKFERVDEVREDSMIVLKETNNQLETVLPLRLVQFNQMTEEAKNLFREKKQGFEYGEGASTVTIEDIVRVVVPEAK